MTGDVDHACLSCGKIHADAHEVTLHDGRVVSSYSVDWRKEAEALAVLAMRDKPKRWAFMSDVKQRRGEQAHDDLRALVLSIHNARAAAQQSRGAPDVSA